jgi:hypothetical protein
MTDAPISAERAVRAVQALGTWDQDVARFQKAGLCGTVVGWQHVVHGFTEWAGNLVGSLSPCCQGDAKSSSQFHGGRFGDESCVVDDEFVGVVRVWD